MSQNQTDQEVHTKILCVAGYGEPMKIRSSIVLVTDAYASDD